MPLANYTSEIDATVIYTEERSRFSDEVQGVNMVDMEIDHLWMFGKDWRKSELVDVFGEKGFQYIQKHIFDNAEVDW